LHMEGNGAQDSPLATAAGGLFCLRAPNRPGPRRCSRSPVGNLGTAGTRHSPQGRKQNLLRFIGRRPALATRLCTKTLSRCRSSSNGQAGSSWADHTNCRCRCSPERAGYPEACGSQVFVIGVTSDPRIPVVGYWLSAIRRTPREDRGARWPQILAGVAMARTEDFAAASRALTAIPEQLTTCERVALALVETSQMWVSTGSWFAGKTDFEWARDGVLQSLKDVKRQLQRIRGSELSPDAIRAFAFVESLRKHCESCIQMNQQSIAEGKLFSCPARRELEQPSSGPARFRLDQKGNILESR
jgi:hypothetical protein